MNEKDIYFLYLLLITAARTFNYSRLFFDMLFIDHTPARTSD